jgi:hypothetical protein
MNELSIDVLHEVLTCDPENGVLIWKRRDGATPQWNARWAGKEALATVAGNGYKTGEIFAKAYRAHRVIWAMANGKWPDAHIDHINGDKLDNRIENLRDVPQLENWRNQARPKNNVSGVVGVCKVKPSGKWLAYIYVDRKCVRLGLFSCFEDACAARMKAAAEFGFHPNHGRAA